MKRYGISPSAFFGDMELSGIRIVGCSLCSGGISRPSKVQDYLTQDEEEGQRRQDDERGRYLEQLLKELRREQRVKRSNERT